MTSKQHMKRIRDFFDGLGFLFHLNNFDRTLKLMKEDDPRGFAATINYEEDYQRYVVSIYPSFLRHTLDEQRKMLLHELCHSITIPAKSAMNKMLDGQLITSLQAKEINEKATSQIENIFDMLLHGDPGYAFRTYEAYLGKKKGSKKR